eukprot:Rmarinus@m.1054
MEGRGKLRRVTNLLSQTLGTNDDPTIYSQEFLSQKILLRESRPVLEEVTKRARDYYNTGIAYLTSARRLLVAMNENFVLNKDFQDIVGGDDRNLLTVLQTHMSLIEAFESQMKTIQALLVCPLEQLVSEAGMVRELKNQVYQAHKDKTAALGKMELCSGGKQLTVAQDQYQGACHRFLSVQRDAVNKMADLQDHKGIVVAEGLCGLMEASLTFAEFSSSATPGISLFLDDIRKAVDFKRREANDSRLVRHEEAKRLDVLSKEEQGMLDRDTLIRQLQDGTLVTPRQPNRFAGEGVFLQLERVVHLCQWGATPGILYCTNFRITFLPYEGLPRPGQRFDAPNCSVARIENFGGEKGLMALWCKDLRTFRLSFRFCDNEVSKVFDSIVPFVFCDVDRYFVSYYRPPPLPQGVQKFSYDARAEFARVGVPNSRWRLTETNVQYELCPTYPRVLAVPASITDRELSEVANFRSKGRFPALCWTWPPSLIPSVADPSKTLFVPSSDRLGPWPPSLLVRSSQPCVGLTRQHSDVDKKLLYGYVDAPSASSRIVLIFDARPRLNAVGNKAMGGGWEDLKHLKGCTLEFLGIENIHVMRKAFSLLHKSVVTPKRARQHTMSVSPGSLRPVTWASSASDSLSGLLPMAVGTPPQSPPRSPTLFPLSDQHEGNKLPRPVTMLPQSNTGLLPPTPSWPGSSSPSRSVTPPPRTRPPVSFADSGTTPSPARSVTPPPGRTFSPPRSARPGEASPPRPGRPPPPPPSAATRSTGTPPSATLPTPSTESTSGGTTAAAAASEGFSLPVPLPPPSALGINDFRAADSAPHAATPPRGTRAITFNLPESHRSHKEGPGGPSANVSGNIMSSSESLGSVASGTSARGATYHPRMGPDSQLVVGDDCKEWLKHVSAVLLGANKVASALRENPGAAVLVHCSDGWDRTAQLTALAEIFLDPYYRTIDGFMILIEKEWLSFGHKFAQRCGHGKERSNFSDTQRAPIFTQFLDSLYQVLLQFPSSFEFNEALLLLLLQEQFACMYNTFLFNCESERVDSDVYRRGTPVWHEVASNRDMYKNPNYVSAEGGGDGGGGAPMFLTPNADAVVMWPIYTEHLWKDELPSTTLASQLMKS